MEHLVQEVTQRGHFSYFKAEKRGISYTGVLEGAFPTLSQGMRMNGQKTRERGFFYNRKSARGALPYFRTGSRCGWFS